jgi:hypothetical protein
MLIDRRSASSFERKWTPCVSMCITLGYRSLAEKKNEEEGASQTHC